MNQTIHDFFAAWGKTLHALAKVVLYVCKELGDIITHIFTKYDA